MDYTKFKLDYNTILREAIYRCKKELYARAQPSADYDDILAGYKAEYEAGKEVTRVCERYYISEKELLYVLNKYVKAYHLEEVFKDHCDIIITDMKTGCAVEKYIPAHIDENGQYNFGHKDFETAPPLKDIIGEDNANKVIDFVNGRRNFYRFDRTERDFKSLVSLSDSPTSNYANVVEYWKTQGVDLNIDKRELTDDQFWDEEHGISEEAE